MRIKNDKAEDWLRENDPLYGKKKCPYLNNNRFRWVTRKEKPVGLLKDVLEYAEQSGSRRVVT